MRCCGKEMGGWQVSCPGVDGRCTQVYCMAVVLYVLELSIRRT